MLALLRLLLAGLCLVLTMALLLPESAIAYVALGPALGVSQRHFRVHNNFLDPSANDNATPDAQFPGQLGAPLAIWKASVEWGSGPHGDGSGDPTQAVLGSGAANFDASFQGLALSPGGPHDNTHSATTAAGLGLVGFAEGDGNGWRIVYYEDWTWSDGPGPIDPGQFDLQSVAAHEYGHALGLGHTSVSGATMSPAATAGSTEPRSIELDDILGLQSLYGGVVASKPIIHSVEIGANVVLGGSNFHPTNNTVWFTEKAPGGSGVPIQATGIPATQGGTQIVLATPTGAGRGDVLVRTNGFAGTNLSNAYPFDAEGPVPSSPIISAVTPRQLPSITPNADDFATLTGTGFDLVTELRVDGQALFAIPPAWTILSPTAIQFQVPIQSALGTIPIEVSGPLGSDTILVEVVAPPEPVLRIGNGNDPEEIFSFLPTDVRMGGLPGAVMFLGASLSNVPLSIPPFIDLDIGGTSVPHLVGTFAIEAQGWTEQNFFFQLPFGTILYWQIVEFDPVAPVLPLPKSGVASTFFVF